MRKLNVNKLIRCRNQLTLLLNNVRSAENIQWNGIGTTAAATADEDDRLPSYAQVVIAGAGVVGNSVAYHLIENGWQDIYVLEQNQIGSGSSSFGSGILGMFKPTAVRNLIKSSIELYQHLENKGFNIGMTRCGSLNLAQTKDRIIAMKRRIAYNRPTGLQCELIGPDDIKRMHPLIRIDNLEGGVWVPDDAVADPQAICFALMELAKEGGAKYYEHCPVDRVNVNGKKVQSVDTAMGRISCEYFVNCAGMWSRELGLKSDPPICIPTYAAKHFYAMTKGINVRTKDMLPVVRDYDAHTYIRQMDNELMVGWFEKDAKVAFGNNPVPRTCHHDIVDDDTEHCRPLWDDAIERIPILGGIDYPIIRKMPNNFTPDGRWILGEAAEVKNYFVAVGMNGNSLQGAGGIGKAVAEWIIEGSPTQELVLIKLET